MFIKNPRTLLQDVDGTQWYSQIKEVRLTEGANGWRVFMQVALYPVLNSNQYGVEILSRPARVVRSQIAWPASTPELSQLLEALDTRAIETAARGLSAPTPSEGYEDDDHSA